MGDDGSVLKTVERMLAVTTPALDPARLKSFVASFFDRREQFLNLPRQHGSPLYVIDEKALMEQAGRFAAAFRSLLQDIRFFYAMKSNNHPVISEILLRCGFGLDVSSGEELKQAIKLNAREIIFSGPGKTDGELSLAVQHGDRVTVLMDSFGELERLERTAAASGKTVRAGVRLTTDEKGLWRKFGIPLTELPRFLQTARNRPHVSLQGLQFHTSWNLTPDNQVNFIARLGKTLRQLDPETRALLKFIDIGGGYWPSPGEWLHPVATPEGKLKDCVAPGTWSPLDHRCLPAMPLEPFARKIADAVRAHIFPHATCAVFAEPGRWICHDAMHILLTVVDKKADDLVITDAGTNAVGWERFESDYFPVLNLTRPGPVERECMILGSLCTPHDVWGYAYFGDGIEPGDVLVIPCQGAYTYSLRQHFIKPLPATAVLGGTEPDTSKMSSDTLPTTPHRPEDKPGGHR